ncbi:general stress protein [Mycolicibacterium sp. GF69]|uniref:general stress protein n=1 Tax=Mycolicibacterium sp. GF69 TaxID=2267251 RepID=UPI001F0C6940|nr:general stress protein [Mycolicibacterium sp. GF69]
MQPVGEQQPARHVVASFDNYADAQRLVDRMSDGGFPVEHVRIIGDGVRTVERVTGRMTKSRAAFAGAASGAWFGLFIGLLLAIFTLGPAWIVTLLIALVIGAFWGAVFGFVAHLASGGERDFSSVQSLEAQRYDVCVAAQYAAEAARFTHGA